MFPLLSVAEQAAVVVPTANVDPLGGTQARFVTNVFSVAVAVNVTLLLVAWPVSVLKAIFVGQVSCGGSLSNTVTLKLHCAEFLLPSVATQVTVVIPSKNVEPFGGAQTKLTTPQLSVPLAA